MVAVHNLGPEPRTVPLQLDGLRRASTRLVDLLADGQHARSTTDGRGGAALEGYGYRWLRVVPPDGTLLA